MRLKHAAGKQLILRDDSKCPIPNRGPLFFWAGPASSQGACQFKLHRPRRNAELPCDGVVRQPLQPAHQQNLPLTLRQVLKQRQNVLQFGSIDGDLFGIGLILGNLQKLIDFAPRTAAGAPPRVSGR